MATHGKYFGEILLSGLLSVRVLRSLCLFGSITDDRDQKIVINRNYILSLTMMIIPFHSLSVNPTCVEI